MPRAEFTVLIAASIASISDSPSQPLTATLALCARRAADDPFNVTPSTAMVVPVIDARKADEATTQEAFDYYLGWITNPSVQPRFSPPSGESLSFASRWGAPGVRSRAT